MSDAHSTFRRSGPLARQQKIAGILSAYDDLIENNARRIAVLEEMAQSLYREWFVRFRFPGCDDVKLTPSTLGEVPNTWSVGNLADYCDGVIDCEHKTAPTQAQGFPLIRTPNIGKSYLLLDDVKRVSEATYSVWTRRAIPRPGN